MSSTRTAAVWRRRWWRADRPHCAGWSRPRCRSYQRRARDRCKKIRWCKYLTNVGVLLMHLPRLGRRSSIDRIHRSCRCHPLLLLVLLTRRCRARRRFAMLHTGDIRRVRSALVSLIQLAAAAIVELVCIVGGIVMYVLALEGHRLLAAEAVGLVCTAHRRRSAALLHCCAQIVNGGWRCQVCGLVAGCSGAVYRFVCSIRFVCVRGTFGYVVQMFGGALYVY